MFKIIIELNVLYHYRYRWSDLHCQISAYCVIRVCLRRVVRRVVRHRMQFNNSEEIIQIWSCSTSMKRYFDGESNKDVFNNVYQLVSNVVVLYVCPFLKEMTHIILEYTIIFNFNFDNHVN